MRNLLNNKLLFFIFFGTFLITLCLFNNVNEQGRFYEENRDYYQMKIKSDFLTGIPYEKSNLLTGIEKLTSSSSIIEFDLPNYNVKSNTKIILPKRSLKNPLMAEGKYFDTEDTRAVAVIGKDVFETLSRSERKTRRLNILGENYRVIGILKNSPYNESVLINGNHALSRKEVSSLVRNMSILSPFLNQSNHELITIKMFFGYPPPDPNNSRRYEVQPDAENFTKMSGDFKIFAIELFIVAVLSIAIQYYQKFDYWKKEIGIRKMIGGTTLGIITTTFSKYLSLLSVAFIAAVLIFLVSIQYFSLSTDYGLSVALKSCLDVGGLYLGLLIILLLSTTFYVKRMSIISILAGEDE